MRSVWHDRVEMIISSEFLAVSGVPLCKIETEPLRQTSVICSFIKLGLLITVYVYLMSSIEALEMLCRNFQ